ncbi:deoxyguanosinetriphosphate triphosphohydrolase [Wansuia hejianensis]|uniref:Deoxyguanosinetriphosphate triphosphohydrolase-like protein n=1 Tax=Wansuia hejianensis TaxID=2763667 RepID=A0A926F2I7_9FIRM|nr:deoxyguanosinetriphosphate triphosphohydrolase [Wansuia hejianensis]MBC8590755.1 deoxyguanosinetriphosphate triphosphohydrolase [Wansuia hejianensis]
MIIRKQIEKIEKDSLSSLATLSSNSMGRIYYEEKCDIRTEFQRDRDRILHSKAFRRLKHKTQVFVAPEGDHYRTRLTHTLEVAQIGRTLARALRLNEDLVEAISLGHDLGHTPFGHTGERILNELHPNGFKHNQQSLRIVDILEHNEHRIGLNLTEEVREGIINHSGHSTSKTLEGQIVSIADRIAYINHDIDDAIRANIIKEDDLPKDCVNILGKSHGIRINTMIVDVIKNSLNKNKISMSKEIGEKTEKLRMFMFENVYYNIKAKPEEEKVEYIIRGLYNYYLDNVNKLPSEIKVTYPTEYPIEDRICDYISGMTDRYVVNLYSNLFIPKPWEKY